MRMPDEVPQAVVDRIMSKVRKTSSDCWVYEGCLMKNGYGQTTFWDKEEKRRVHATTHRIMWVSANGPVPEGAHLDHLCHDPSECQSTQESPCQHRACCNPSHIAATTERRNIRRGGSFAGVNARKTHCIRGHEFTPENTYWIPSGAGRSCRACQRYRDERRKSR